MTRFDRCWMFGLAVAAVLLAVGDLVFGSCSGLLHLLPFGLLLVPLLRGRYLCERYLARTPRVARPRHLLSTPTAVARPGHDRVVRGSALVGSGLARRPPPLLTPA